jgi:hypothetical protein
MNKVSHYKINQDKFRFDCDFKNIEKNLKVTTKWFSLVMYNVTLKAKWNAFSW